MPRLICLLLRTVCSVCSLAGAVQTASGETPKAVDHRLQGEWVLARAERNGESAKDLLGHRLQFQGKQFVIRSVDAKRLYWGAFQVDPSQSPATIDFAHSQDELKGKVWKGIYSLSGDQLQICDNAPNLEASRPTEFRAPAGSGHVALVFQRAESSTVDDANGRQPRQPAPSTRRK